MSAAGDEIAIEGVRLTSPDKVLYPEQAITKRQLAEYYVAVAPWMLPHVVKRPITLVRCPTGRQKKCFYQRHAGSGVPAELKTVVVPGFEESGGYLYLEAVGGLLALVQMGVLELHPWNARVENPERPDRVIFDLDPGEGLSFADVVAGAFTVREALERRSLTAFVKTTGGKGLHVVVPIVPEAEWAEVKAFARGLGEDLSAAAPDRFLTQISKAKRRGRIFIDYLRNDATSTAVAPYSTRARPGATVSTPLAWDELTPALDPSSFTVETVPGRLRRLKADPWRDLPAIRQSLPAP